MAHKELKFNEDARRDAVLGHPGLTRETDALFDAIGRAKAQVAGRLFLDIHVDDDLIGRGAFARADIRIAEEAKGADAFRAFTDLARVERVAFDNLELAADLLHHQVRPPGHSAQREG